MTNDATTKVTKWLSEPLPADVSQALDRLAQTDDVYHVAVMPDVHLAGEVCNGTAIATRELIYPQAVGSDIGCGMLAVACDLPAHILANELTAARVLAGLYQHVPANKQPGGRVPEQLPDELMRHDLSSPSLERLKARDGLYQLGSLGRGNHFVEFQSDLQGRLWLMLHSGSRGMGQAISEHHLRLAELSVSGLSFLNASQPDGVAYLSDLNWAIEYAMQNRLAMARADAVRDRIRLDIAHSQPPQPCAEGSSLRPGTVGPSQRGSSRSRVPTGSHPRLDGQPQLPCHRTWPTRVLAVEFARSRASDGQAAGSTTGITPTSTAADARCVVQSATSRQPARRSTVCLQRHWSRDAGAA
jgi:tRNA-splicing ligase RtcB